MRILIIGLLISISLPAFAQEKETDKTVSQETQAVLERVDAAGEWMSGTLDSLASKMGTTVEYLWPTFVKKVFAIGLIQLSIGIILLISSIIFSIIFFRLGKRCSNTNHGKEIDLYIAGVVFLVIGIVLFMLFASFGIINMVSPEPAALIDITLAIGHLR